MKGVSTIDVVWREDRGCWSVEGGNGTTAVLGIVALHQNQRDALIHAEVLARDHEAEVRVLPRS